MPRRRPPVDLHVLARIGALYYHRGRTQQQIAERFHMSRARVSHLLKEARGRGIVQILVNAPQGVHVELEEGLEERFGLNEALVADTERDATEEALRRQLGRTAAGYLARTLEDGQSIGIAWGPTMHAVVQAVSPASTTGVRVIQLSGGIGAPNEATYASDIVRRLARRLSATPVVLPTPGIVGTAEAASALRADRHVAAVLEAAGTVDVAFTGIGSADYNPVISGGHAGEVPDLAELGAVGDMLLRYFDDSGKVLATLIDERWVGITAEQLRRIPRLVAVAGGASKYRAIRAGLRTGMLQVLVTDRTTAEALLAEPPDRVPDRAEA